jgi:hypothetical protein
LTRARVIAWELAGVESYRGSPGWVRYRRLLASEFGIEVPEAPEEIRLQLRGHDLHVDQ